MTRVNRARLGTALVLAGLFSVTAARTAGAQSADTDPRWHAWLGCWAPLLSADTAGVGLTGDTRVCMTPAGTPQAVEMVTIAGDRIVNRERIEATGIRRDIQLDGCKGWEQAEWSQDGRRLYRQTEATCAAGVKRTSTQVFAMSPEGEWLDVMSAALGTSSGVRIGRYQAVATPSPVLPAEARTALDLRFTDIGRARTAIVAPVGIPDIIDASRHVSPVLVQAWLGEMGKTFDVTGRQLVQLADAGVSGAVTDLLVAMTYPNAFELRPRSSVSRSGGGGSGMSDAAIDQLMDSAYRSGLSSGLMGCSRFGMGWGDCSYYDYARVSPYGYGRYGYLPYGTWYMGAEPIVVVAVPSGGSTAGQGHGQLVKGRGYVEGGTGSASRSGSSDSSSGSSSSGSSSSSSGSSGGSSSSTPSSSSGGSEPRTAHPR